MVTRILLVDDEPNVLKSLRRALHGEGYEVLTAGAGGEALTILQNNEIAVVVSDYSMPGMTGERLLAQVYELHPDTVRVMLTAHQELRVATASINVGRANHFLFKPWDDDHFRAVLRDAVKSYRMKQEIRELHRLTCSQRDQLKQQAGQLEDRVRERTEALEEAYEDTLNALVAALDARERPTAGHSRRVALYSLFLAIQAGLPRDSWKNLYRGAILHDIGKIGIPDAILLKPGKLDAEERRVIEQHVVIGARILEQIGHLKEALAIPRYHHERYDGAGYAQGLAGDQIPIEARVFAIIDVYDALRSRRPYKDPISHEEACRLIASESGRHFDPDLVAVFMEISPRQWSAMGEEAIRSNRFADALRSCLAIAERFPSEAVAV